MPRVMNVDKNPAYPAAVEALKAEGTLPRRVVLRQCKYLNNLIEQDHRTVKKRVWLAKGYGSFYCAWRTLQGIETVHMTCRSLAPGLFTLPGNRAAAYVVRVEPDGRQTVLNPSDPIL